METLLDFSPGLNVPHNSGVMNTRTTEPFVFGDEDFAFLENRSGMNRPAAVNTLDFSTARLRDPAKEQEDQRREIRRMTYQQVSPDGSNALQEFITGVRSFNMQRQGEAIKACLEELQGQRKEIRLIGRLGSVVYPKDSSLANKVFEYQELARNNPEFSPM